MASKKGEEEGETLLHPPSQIKVISTGAATEEKDYSSVPNKRVSPIKRVSWNFDH